MSKRHLAVFSRSRRVGDRNQLADVDDIGDRGVITCRDVRT